MVSVVVVGVHNRPPRRVRADTDGRVRGGIKYWASHIYAAVRGRHKGSTVITHPGAQFGRAGPSAASVRGGVIKPTIRSVLGAIHHRHAARVDALRGEIGAVAARAVKISVGGIVIAPVPVRIACRFVGLVSGVTGICGFIARLCRRLLQLRCCALDEEGISSREACQRRLCDRADAEEIRFIEFVGNDLHPVCGVPRRDLMIGTVTHEVAAATPVRQIVVVNENGHVSVEDRLSAVSLGVVVKDLHLGTGLQQFDPKAFLQLGKTVRFAIQVSVNRSTPTVWHGLLFAV